MAEKRIQAVVKIGIDESGRGPLAGPVVAVAITGQKISLPAGRHEFSKKFGKIKDSKKTSPKKREEIYDFLKVHPQIKWGMGRVSEKVIDKINIFEATKLAMRKALGELLKKEKKMKKKEIELLIDGNFGIDSEFSERPIIKGDEKIFIISLASIIAKVDRDRMMLKYHKRYPQYGFDRHKGYGTELHVKMLKKYGPCQIHRKTFYPVNRY